MLWPRGEAELKTRVVAAVVLVLLGRAVGFVGPYVLKVAVDRMSAHAAFAVVGGLVLAYAIARFAGVLADNLRNAIFEKVGQDAARRLAGKVFRHVHDLSLRFHLERRTGSLTKIVERGTKSIDMMLYFILFNIAPTVIELAGICVIFYVKFGAGLVAATLAIVVIYIAFTRKVSDWRTHIQRQMNDVDNKAIGRAVNSLLNYETVKYFGAEDREAKRYEEAVGAFARASVRNEVSLAWLNVGQSLITNLMMAGAMIFTVWGWSKGRFTPGDVVWINGLLMQLFRPLDMLGWVYRSIRQGLIDMEAMWNLLDTPAEVVDVAAAPALDVKRGNVRFEHVRFGYDADREILKGLDLDIPSGTSCAIVGPSGAGKSTIARLLYRFYDPTGGRILIDGQDIAEVDQRSLRAAIGIVPQDTVLFNDTIGYNIGYGRGGASQAEIERAARGASIDTFIASLPEKYEFDGRRARAEAFRRREAARGDRPHLAQEPADPRPRRSDQRARQPDRGSDPADARPGLGQPHHHHDRAPAVDDRQRRPDHRARRRARRRARNARGTAQPRRPLRRPVAAPGRRTAGGGGCASGGVRLQRRRWIASSLRSSQ